jgi:Obg family GTPase CgtA-like protein
VRESIDVREESGGFRVRGNRIVAFAEMMPLGVDEGVEEAWRRFGLWGVKTALRKAGARSGDKVLIGDAVLEMRA